MHASAYRNRSTNIERRRGLLDERYRRIEVARSSQSRGKRRENMSLHIQILRNYYENRVMPLNFEYNEEAKTVDIEFADGSVVRYYDIAPTVAFLDSRNPA